MLNKEKIIYKAGRGECDYCGISSFDHIHLPNTLPKDFVVKDPDEDLKAPPGVKSMDERREEVRILEVL